MPNSTLASFQDLKAVKDQLEQPTRPASAKVSSKNQRSHAAKETIALLKNLYPAVFNFESPLPLAVGIEKQLKALHPEIALPVLRLALVIWTGREKYLLAVIKGKQRHNLDGSDAQLVQESEQNYSKMRIEKKHHKIKRTELP